MSAIDKMLDDLDPRYSMGLEYGGWKGQRVVLRFCGDPVGDYDDFISAVEAAEKHPAKSSWKLMVKNGSVMWLNRNGLEHRNIERVAYGADVREFYDEHEAAARFGYCVLHQRKCG